MRPSGGKGGVIASILGRQKRRRDTVDMPLPGAIDLHDGLGYESTARAFASRRSAHRSTIRQSTLAVGRSAHRLGMVPMKRGQTDEIANAIVWLMSTSADVSTHLELVAS